MTQKNSKSGHNILSFLPSSNDWVFFLRYLLHRQNIRNIILNSVRQHNHFITQGNYKATCFDNRLVIFRPIFVN